MNSTLHRPIHLRVALALLLAAVLPSTGAAAADPVQAPAGALTLSDCTRIALAQNPDLVSSGQGVVSAGAALTGVRSAYSPQLAVDVREAVGSEGSTSAGASGLQRTEQASFALSQILWQSGLQERVAESQSRLAAAELGYSIAVQSLLEQVASDYYGVLADDRIVAVQEAAVDSAASHLQQVQARIRAGVAAEVDVYTAQDDFACAELALVDARRDATLARARLKTSMGVSATFPLTLGLPQPMSAAAVPSLEEAIATAEQTRPDVRRASTLVEATRSSLDLAKIGRGPASSVSATYDWGYINWESGQPSWQAGLVLSWPLFDGGAAEADVVAARAALAASQAQFQSVVNQAGFEVESALAEVKRAQERVRTTATSVAAADARLRAAEGKYQQGVGILLEVTDARAALTDALAGQVQAEYDYRTSLVTLERALGRLAPPPAATG